MGITTIYRVDASIPRSVYEDESGNPAPGYDHAVSCAIEGHVGAGSDAYGGEFLEEWAEFHSLQAAQRCERRLALIAAGVLDLDRLRGVS